jgi:Tetratricopeptide repeat
LAESSRIEELRRRVQLDPASIAFAALAEEYRRAGRYEEAIAVCESGLQRHPAYLSARVTLGRSLLELSRYDEARAQLEHVLRVAPENLAAIRGLAEIHHRTGETRYDTAHERAAAEAAGGSATAGVPAAQPLQPAPPVAAAPEAAAPPAAAAETAAAPEPPPASVPLRPVPVKLSTMTEPASDVSEPPPGPRATAEPAPVPRPQVSPIPVVIQAAEAPGVSAPAPAPVIATAPRHMPHPDETALPALEAFLAAIIRARGADASGSSPGL